ncbi:MAG: hypothetical protein EA382_05170 [Spirochaetaceae bacterium]|nr:MAG: hypothetical protein EA382_05170 [Spirochaetaceae bacterium]
MRFRRTVPVLMIGLLLIAAGAWADSGVPEPRQPTDRSVRMLGGLEPVKEYLSGRAWLTMEGIDPGLWIRPGYNTLTRMDWNSIGNHLYTPPNVPEGAAAAIQSPALQAVGGGLLVPFRDPAPAFSRDLLITRDFSATPIQTEPHIAANPNDPDHLVMGTIDYNFPAVSAYVSVNGGLSWEGPIQVPFLRDDRVSGGDPVISFDRDGNVYYAMISIGIDEFAIGPLQLADIVSSMAVAVSTDGGYTWEETVSAARSEIRLEDQQIDPSGRLRGTIVAGFLDKPWMTVGRHHRDPARDVIYLTYTDFEVASEIYWIGEVPTLLTRQMATTIRVVRSEDQGRTWSDPVAVSPTVNRSFGEAGGGVTPGMFGTDRVVQGPQPLVGSDGTVYVVWLDSTDDGSMEGLGEIQFARSTDGGRTFSAPVIASVFNEIGFRPRNAFFRYWGASFPQAAIGPNDELYVVYTARPSGRPQDDGDIYFIRSFDRGSTWSRPERVNGDETDRLQFFPAISVAPDGSIHVMWGDMRDDPVHIRYHIYYTTSDDRGTTWGFELPDLGHTVRDTRVTDFPSNPNRGFPQGLFIGDYFAIEATETDVYMVWADTRLAEFGGVNQKIGFARRRPIRSPDIFVSPPAGPGGQNVTIQGFNFQPDMTVFITLEDATIASARTNLEGRFTTSLYMPITGEGPQRLAVYDQSGNMASTSYYTEFGFGDIETMYRDLQEQLRELMDELRRRN